MQADVHEGRVIEGARHPALARFVREHAVRFGDFTLVSGAKSNFYMDGKQVTFDPEGALLIAEAVLDELEGMEVDAVGGMDMGATPIVPVVAVAALKRGRRLPSFIVRKEVKKHGTQKMIEGLVPQKPGRVVIIDDVVTKGGSILKAIKAVRDQGHTVVMALSVVDREAGGGEMLEAEKVPFRPLVRLSELGLENPAG